jgi:hypothetical protein
LAIAQMTPLFVPLAEMTGVAPGEPKERGPMEIGLVVKKPLVRANAFNCLPLAAKKTLPL